MVALTIKYAQWPYYLKLFEFSRETLYMELNTPLEDMVPIFITDPSLEARVESFYIWDHACISFPYTKLASYAITTPSTFT